MGAWSPHPYENPLNRHAEQFFEHPYEVALLVEADCLAFGDGV
jgi:hypothetical protein